MTLKSKIIHKDYNIVIDAACNFKYKGLAI